MKALLVLIFLVVPKISWTKTLIFAHRGASGFLPEHTIAAVSMAHALDPDYIEPDVVLTKDGVLIVAHDIHLEDTTNVEEVFPKKNRKDGHYYAIDLSWKEIQLLKVHERRKKDGSPKFPQRLIVGKEMDFRISSLDGYIDLVVKLNSLRGKNIGIYPEIKASRFHLDEGQDITLKLVELLKKKKVFGGKGLPLIIQSFESAPLKRLRKEFNYRGMLSQNIGMNYWKISSDDYQKMLTKPGLIEIKKYANSIGAWYPMLLDKKGKVTQVVRDARDVGIKIHAYTLRREVVPAPFKSPAQFMNALKKKVKADGLFTDYP